MENKKITAEAILEIIRDNSLSYGRLNESGAVKEIMELINSFPSEEINKQGCEHEYITDADWQSLTCRKCNDRIKPKQL